MYKTIDEIPADLKWLAENLHKWTDDPGYQFVTKYRTQDLCAFSVCRVGPSFYHYDEWQSARDVISGKPGWDEAPEWAEYKCQGTEGMWEFFEDRPEPGPEYWDSDCRQEGSKFRGKVLGDWRDTLEHRPSDHTNELLDGDAPVITPTDFKVNGLENALRDEVNTTTQALRVNHEDGFIDVERLTGGGVMLTDQDGQEIHIKSKAVLEAITDAAYSLM